MRKGERRQVRKEKEGAREGRTERGRGMRVQFGLVSPLLPSWRVDNTASCVPTPSSLSLDCPRSPLRGTYGCQSRPNSH